jgi:hypothetical protein
MSEPLITFYEPCSLHILVDSFSILLILFFCTTGGDELISNESKNNMHRHIRDKTFVALINTLLIESLLDTSFT